MRADAHALRAQLAALVHTPTLLAVVAERAVSRTLGGSCSMPLAAHAVWDGDALVLRAAAAFETARPFARIDAPVGTA